MTSSRPLRAASYLLLAAASGLLGGTSAAEPRIAIPADFEPHEGLVLAGDLVETAPEVLLSIARATEGRLRLLLLIGSEEQRELADGLLRPARLEGVVELHQVAHDTMWVRDYLPLVGREHDGSAILIDTLYSEDRERDDAVPRLVGELLSLPVLSLDLRLDGGNLLTNGDGLFLTTDRLPSRNEELGWNEDDILHLFETMFASEQTTILEPLLREPTAHVDMFATFLARNKVVVMSLDPELDPENAALLDRNAAMLAGRETSRGPLEVFRIEMPPEQLGTWRSYTNVVFANGVLLVPVYPDADPRGSAYAIASYRALLPGWHIEGIDVSSIAGLGGVLHCITRPLLRVPLLAPAAPDLASTERHAHLEARPTPPPGEIQNSRVTARN